MLVDAQEIEHPHCRLDGDSICKGTLRIDRMDVPVVAVMAHKLGYCPMFGEKFVDGLDETVTIEIPERQQSGTGEAHLNQFVLIAGGEPRVLVRVGEALKIFGGLHLVVAAVAGPGNGVDQGAGGDEARNGVMGKQLFDS